MTLKRAFANLIDNAVKYGEHATVSLAAQGGELLIHVDDRGQGIPEEQWAKVLQPFYRVEASRSPDTGGIGLGLADRSLPQPDRERRGMAQADA